MEHFLVTGKGNVINQTVELTALRKSGEEFHVNLSISDVRIDLEWIFIAFVSDISERKRMEERFILKTPLTTIKAYAQLALSQEERCSELVKNFLLKIDQFTGKLNQLVKELLDVSRMHTGYLYLVSAEVNLKTFCEDVITSIQVITPKQQIIIDKNEHALVHIDVLRMDPVITNLISNAAKYSPGKDKIIFRSELTEGALKISCADFGIGIAEENLQKVSTQFYRIESSASGFSGLGIGLFISMEIIKHHGGDLWVESKFGEESTFFITLPLL